MDYVCFVLVLCQALAVRVCRDFVWGFLRPGAYEVAISFLSESIAPPDSHTGF